MTEETSDETSLIRGVRRIKERNVDNTLMPFLEAMNDATDLDTLRKRLISLEEVVQCLPKYFQRQEQLEARTAQLEKCLQKTMEVLIPRLDRVLVEIQKRPSRSTEVNPVGSEPHNQSATDNDPLYATVIPAAQRNTCQSVVPFGNVASQHETIAATTVWETESSSSSTSLAEPVVHSEEGITSSTASLYGSESSSPVDLENSSIVLPTNVASTSTDSLLFRPSFTQFPSSSNNHQSLENVSSAQLMATPNTEVSESSPDIAFRGPLQRDSEAVPTPYDASSGSGGARTAQSLEDVGSAQTVPTPNTGVRESFPDVALRGLLRHESATFPVPPASFSASTASRTAPVAPAGGSLHRVFTRRPSASLVLPSVNLSLPAAAVGRQSLPANATGTLLGPSNASLAQGEPPLIAAAARGDANALRRLLAAGSGGAEERDANGDTALHAAAAGGHCDALLALLAAWANADARGRRLRTPLHCACAAGHVTVARRLLRAGADPKAEDADGATPLALAAESGHAGVVTALLARGAPAGARDKRGLTPAARAAAAGHTEALAALLRGGVSPDECDAAGRPLLVHAASAGRWDVARLLLQSGASAASSASGGDSALALAAEAGHVDAVRELLRQGGGCEPSLARHALARAASPAVVWAFVDSAPHALRGDAGRHALLSALLAGRIEVLKALLDAGVDIGKDVEGEGEEQVVTLLALLAEDRVSIRKKSTKSSFRKIFKKHKK